MSTYNIDYVVYADHGLETQEAVWKESLHNLDLDNFIKEHKRIMAHIKGMGMTWVDSDGQFTDYFKGFDNESAKLICTGGTT